MTQERLLTVTGTICGDHGLSDKPLQLDVPKGALQVPRCSEHHHAPAPLPTGAGDKFVSLWRHAQSAGTAGVGLPTLPIRPSILKTFRCRRSADKARHSSVLSVMAAHRLRAAVENVGADRGRLCGCMVSSHR